jgi:DNA-binding transcriptional ArsR family regulator
VQKILQALKILSDKTRLKIVSLLLAENELCVCELMKALRMSQSRISNHLRILRNTGIIEAKREGKWIFYSLARGTMDKVLWEIVQAIADEVDKRGYLTREKILIKRLISRRGEPGHCPLPN